jgi:phosphoribosyl-dephospho-CoA transferase
MTLATAQWPWRHRRIWLDPRSLEGVRLVGATAGEERELLDAIGAWARTMRPFVARAWTAADAGRPDAHVPLGLALFGAAGKRRVSFTAPRALVARVEPPLPLRAALPLLAPGHARAARQVLQAIEPLHAEVTVYGSAFWSHAAGELRMSSASDLDLLVRPAPSGSPEALLAVLQQVAAGAEVRLDGEVLLRDGSTVAWRELAAGPARVLAKTDSGPELRVLQQALEQW